MKVVSAAQDTLDRNARRAVTPGVPCKATASSRRQRHARNRRRPRPRDFVPGFSRVLDLGAAPDNYGTTSHQRIEEEDEDDFRDGGIIRLTQTETSALDEHIRQAPRISDHGIMTGR
jgi:hypothetical protein